MHLIRLKPLVTQLSLGTCSEKHKWMYFVAYQFVILCALVSSDFYSAIDLIEVAVQKAPFQAQFQLGAIVKCLIYLFGYWSCFKLNFGKKGTQFLERFVCLSIPICFRVLVLYLLLSLMKQVAWIYDPLFFSDQVFIITDMLIGFACDLFYFGLIGMCLVEIRSKPETLNQVNK
ncbi:hypothetical protein HOG98_01250 [bacterium]|jgi:hypothetical protein|nr:hypothetical protein [bacterium]